MSGGLAPLLPALGIGICAALLAVIINTAFNLRAFRRKPPADLPPGSAAPLVSVLVPARNEAAAIADCLSSLQAQTWPDFEIIVLDDQSEDDTTDRARALGFAGEGRLRVLPGKPLPGGWVGKCWACHQLSEAANGEILMFTDADTIHSPGSVAAAVRVLRADGAGLLSLWPGQTLHTWSEKLVIPIGYILFIGLLPLALFEWMVRKPGIVRLIPRRQLAGLGVSNGQCLVFERDVYHRVGGHGAVRGNLVEDVAFGRLFASLAGEGIRVINRDGSGLVRCRMYATFRALWEGFSKNLRPAFEDDVFAYCFSGALLFTLFVAPFAGAMIPGPAQPWFVAACAMVIGLRAVLALHFRTGWWSVALHPAGMVLALVIALNSWRWTLSQSLRWKGRRYPA